MSSDEQIPAPAAVPDEQLQAALGADRAALWTLPREGYRPELSVVRDHDGAPRAAVLTSGRPATAATKIVDVWWRSGAEADAEALVRSVVERARERGDVAVKWQVAPDAPAPALIEALGFAELRHPWSALGTEGTRGFVRWLTDAPAREPGYYAQSTLFTCGSVAALIAADAHGHAGFAGDGVRDRDLEVGFWRRASNYPACEPVGLAVALQEHLPSLGVEVALDHDGPVLIEGFTGFDRDFRAELQAESAQRAEALGIPLRRDRAAVDEIIRRVGAGECALLLIDEEPMHGETGPHWVTAHGVAGAALVVDDPWINVEAGETWVDTHAMPVLPGDVDRLVRWSDAGYRGVVFTAGR
ncbi:peptidase C39 family protein [Microbacterium sp. BWT-B31]|uniref:peptidase C39 family protein n=1 Tax=Microbacterium sp. BWT-B31 TaxID=3232072 RepID=UPI003526E81E